MSKRPSTIAFLRKNFPGKWTYNPMQQRWHRHADGAEAHYCAVSTGVEDNYVSRLYVLAEGKTTEHTVESALFL